MILGTGIVVDLKNISKQPAADIVLDSVTTSVVLGTLTLDMKNINNKVLLSGAIGFRFNATPETVALITELGPLLLTITSNGTEIYAARIGETGVSIVEPYVGYNTLGFEWLDDPVTSSICNTTVVYEFILSVPDTIAVTENVTISAIEDYYSLTAMEVQI
ncbi:hypothetical protein [Clostridium sp.]|uniref:hypothetical protein n=1 Tax=Clostridium sp. TaxID=1506 RepID=UPI003D6CDEE4